MTTEEDLATMFSCTRDVMLARSDAGDPVAWVGLSPKVRGLVVMASIGRGLFRAIGTVDFFEGRGNVSWNKRAVPVERVRDGILNALGFIDPSFVQTPKMWIARPLTLAVQVGLVAAPAPEIVTTTKIGRKKTR